MMNDVIDNLLSRVKTVTQKAFSWVNEPKTVRHEPGCQSHEWRLSCTIATTRWPTCTYLVVALDYTTRRHASDYMP